MKKIIGILILIAIVVFAVRAISNRDGNGFNPRNDLQNQDSYRGSLTAFEGETFEVSSDGSLLTWTGSTILKKEKGTIEIYDGSFNIYNGNLSGVISFDMNTIKSEAGEGLDNHLKNADFFAADRYLISQLVIDSYEGETLYGELTIKGIPQPVSFGVNLAIQEGSVSIEGSVDIDRTLWGIEYNSSSVFSDLGDKAINDTITLDVSILASSSN
jgi:polyisoprenoid-binding protein YceI